MGRTLALLAGLVSSQAAAATTHALVLGQDEGLASDPPLQFAQADATLMARALVDLGVVSAGRVRLLAGASLAGMTAGLRALGEGLAPEDTVLVFFSGHGGRDGVHVAGQIWSWAEIRPGLSALPARLVVAFFDACRSGALLTAKGQLVRGPPLSVVAEPLGPAGRFFITSSGAHELSYESVLLQGSPFALALRSGLRGLADGDGDGRITLAELYGFVYARTVAATLAAPAGPQHPMELTDLRGAGGAVLVDRLGPGGLERRSAELGACYVLDRAASRVLGELPARGGARLHLAPGAYLVKCLPGSELREGRVTVADRAIPLESIALSPAPRAYALAKGPLAPTRHQIDFAAGVLSGWRGDTTGSVALGYRLQSGGLALSPQLALTGDAGGRGLSLAAAAAMQVPWWKVLGSQLELGVELGGQIGQRPAGAGAPAASGPSLLIGPRLRLQRTVSLARSSEDGPLSFFAELALPTFYPTGSRRVLGALRVLAGISFTFAGGTEER